MPHLLPEFEYHADLEPHSIGPGPFGNRMEGTITGGEVRGERLKGRFVGAGADWLLVGSDGFGRLDVRATIQTVDGAHVYVQYPGLLELTPAILAIMGGGGTPTGFGDQYFVTTPRLETGDERYSWVNQTVFVGEGRVLPGPAVEYRVYRVARGG
ncbi:hypothetical protein JOD57_004708 [Geodermatophilus bullaregiensis]|uniref:DUF3237 domain-containing protein n=1 Tax=Geodermatophilus bullaregiensis TaxID=1564160 RepID=UPI001956D6D8|nr:DUF3237 domain-containing protein [Geodermatophilus bullaregiensis]MBM7808871.1 hypothetical protein [Geodermatophilus bullaregiensis]